MTSRGEGRGARVALWGTFDLENFGDLLFPRIFEHEMRRRLPDPALSIYAPLGSRSPLRLDPSLQSQPLGPWSFARAAELAEAHDLVVVGGGEIVHDHDEFYARWYATTVDEARRLRPSEYFIDGFGGALERLCPMAWHAVGIPFDLDGHFAARVRTALAEREYVAVREELSRERLLSAGVEREIAVVPDSGLVLDRLFSRDLLEERLESLRARGAYPSTKRPLVVQGSSGLVRHVDAVAAAITRGIKARPEIEVVLLEAGPCHGDDEFASALAPRLGGSTYRMPPDATVVDIVSAIAHARAFIGVSLHGTIAALLYRVPSVVLNFPEYSKLDAFAHLVGVESTVVSTRDAVTPALDRALDTNEEVDLTPHIRRVDQHFDTIAGLAEAAAARREREPQAVQFFVQSALVEADRRYELLIREDEDRRARLDQMLQVARAQAGHLVDELRAGVGLVRELRAAVRRAQTLEAELASMYGQAAAANEQVAALERAVETARADVETARAEIERIQATKLFRLAAPLRRAYASARRARR